MPFSKGVVAVIPARGGSKGIKNKNLQTVNGIPLVARAIMTAQNCITIRDVYVSSDSPEILAVAEKFGAKSHLRSEFSASDDASTEDALDDFLTRFDEEECPELLVYIQCTSPFVSSSEIESAIDIIYEQKQIDTIFSAKEFHGFVWENSLKGYSSKGANHDHLSQRKRRQDLDHEYLLEDGAFYILRTSEYLKNKNRFGRKPFAFKSKLMHYSEIDEPSDLDMCRILAPYFDGPFYHQTEEIKLLVSDFDGVMTDDCVQIDMHGNETVRVSRADGMALKIFKNAGIRPIVISSEVNQVVKKRCQKLKITFFQGVENKLSVLREYCVSHNIPLNNVAYVGNDINDLECLMAVGMPFIVKDAALELHKLGFSHIPVNGGDKVFRKLAEMIFKK